MNTFSSFAHLTSATGSALGTQESGSSMVLAAVAIVVAALLGLLAGFFLGTQYGKMSGELRMLKSMKSDRSRKTRSRSSERSSGSEEEAFSAQVD